MTSAEEHEKAAKIFIEDINEKIRRGITVERQKIIGFCASEASTNLFASTLHKKRLIEDGFNVNHQFFSSKKRAEQRFPFDFNNKVKILDLMVKQEIYREKLCYGKEKDGKLVDEAVKNLFELKELIENEG